MTLFGINKSEKYPVQLPGNYHYLKNFLYVHSFYFILSVFLERKIFSVRCEICICAYKTFLG